MENHVLNLLSFFLNESNRILYLNQITKEIKLQPPFDAIVEELKSVKGNLNPSDIINLCKSFLSPIHRNVLRDTPKDIPIGVALKSIEYLIACSKLEKIGNIIKSGENPIKALQRIENITGKNLSFDSNVKPLSELKKNKESMLFNFIYSFKRGHLVVISAYPKVGKTNFLLCLNKSMIRHGLKTLHHIVGDWTEEEVQSKLTSAKFPESAFFGIYPDITLGQISADIDMIKPDVFLLDSMTVVTSKYGETVERYRELGNIAGALKKIAQTHGILVVTCHQMVNYSDYPDEDDLQDSKSHLLHHVDFCLGLGGRYGNSRNITTIASRHEPIRGNEVIIRDNGKKQTMLIHQIEIDFENFEIYNIS